MRVGRGFQPDLEGWFPPPHNLLGISLITLALQVVSGELSKPDLEGEWARVVWGFHRTPPPLQVGLGGARNPTWRGGDCFPILADFTQDILPPNSGCGGLATRRERRIVLLLQIVADLIDNLLHFKSGCGAPSARLGGEDMFLCLRGFHGKASSPPGRANLPTGLEGGGVYIYHSHGGTLKSHSTPIRFARAPQPDLQGWGCAIFRRSIRTHAYHRQCLIITAVS